MKNNIAKVLVLTSFVVLISGFVAFRSGFFAMKNRPTNYEENQVIDTTGQDTSLTKDPPQKSKTLLPSSKVLILTESATELGDSVLTDSVDISKERKELLLPGSKSGIILKADELNKNLSDSLKNSE